MAKLEEDFLAQIAADPFEVSNYLVYADWLEAQGDDDASFIRAMIAAEPEPGPELREMISSRVRRHGIDRGLSDPHHWFRGFLRTAVLSKGWREQILLRPYRLASTLVLGSEEVWDRPTISARDYARIASLPCLRGLTLYGTELLAQPDPEHLAKLERFCLMSETSIQGATIVALASLHELREIMLVDEHSQDLERSTGLDLRPLSTLPRLRTLALLGYFDLDGLRGCSTLTTLHLHGPMELPDLRALARLPRLRRVNISGDWDTRELERARAQLPNVEVIAEAEELDAYVSVMLGLEGL